MLRREGFKDVHFTVGAISVENQKANFVKNENKLNQMLPGNQILKSLELLAKVELDDGSVAENSDNVNEKISAAEGPEDRRKVAQFEVIQNSNPADDDYHAWIRNADEIRTFTETLNDPEWSDYAEFDPDYTREMADEALERGKICNLNSIVNSFLHDKRGRYAIILLCKCK